MHAELFTQPMVIARYGAGPYAEARERCLREAHAQGYSRSTLERMAWVLLVAGHAAHRNGGRLSSERLKTTLVEHMERRMGTPPSAHTVKLLLRSGEAWLRFAHAEEPPMRDFRDAKAMARNLRRHILQEL